MRKRLSVDRQADELEKWAATAGGEDAPTLADTAARLGIKLADGEDAAKEYGRRLALILGRRAGELGLKAPDLARRIGLGHMSVRNILEGVTQESCNHRTFVLLCLALGLHPAKVWEEILADSP